MGLAPPRVSVRVFGAQDEAADADAPLLAELELGVSDEGRGIVARRTDRETVYVAEYALAEHVPVSLEALRNRFVEEPAGEEAEPGSPEAPPVVEGDSAGTASD